MYHNSSNMSNVDTTFEDMLLAALEEKSDWFNKTVLQKMQDDYRLHLTCVSNLIATLVKKSLINSDPYKHDKKISDIVPPQDTEFNENERAMILGTRMSDYESMLDFICNYYKFSVEHITLDKIRKMNDLNSTFNWENLSLNSPKQNTRALAYIVTDVKNGGDNLIINLLNDTLLKAKQSIKSISLALRQLADFQREIYKGNIRREILKNPQCNREKAYHSPAEFTAEVKRLFPTLMGKKPYYSDLIEELIQEEIGPDSAKLRETLLSKLKVVQTVDKKKQEVKVDTREMIMDALRTTGTMCDHLITIHEKFHTNYDLIENGDMSFFGKLKRALRKAFGLKDPPIDYEVIITDHITGMQKKEVIHFISFMDALEKRSKLYASFAAKAAPGYIKMLEKDEEAVLKFVTKNLGEMNTIFGQLSALDGFFKETAPSETKARIKGIKMELTTLKNTMVKANQLRAEYSSYIEEREQMKKLGITV